MDPGYIIEITFKALWMSLVLCGPILIALLILGLVIGILQAATSVNEMTLSFIPKLIALALGLLVFGSWQLVTLVDFTRAIFQRIPTLFS